MADTGTNIELLRQIGKIIHFKKNHMLFMQNDPGDDMYIAVKGTFGVYINSFTDFPVRVAVIGNGLCFGEMSVIDGWSRSATIIAEEDSIALEIKKQNFPRFIEACPTLALGMVKTLSARAQATVEKLREAGKTALDLPVNLREPKEGSPNENMENLLLLSQRIRELNELLGIGKESTIEIKKDTSTLALLPSGHPAMDIPDELDNSKLLGNRSFICPYCYTKFQGKIPLFSRLEENETTLDQRVVYSNFNILLYNNLICPNCNYCDSYQEFTKIPDSGIIPQIRGIQFENAEAFTVYKNELKHTAREAVLSHYLQLECLKQVSKSSLRSAKAWHRLYWLYKDYDEKSLAEKAAAEARLRYDAYVEENDTGISTADLVSINMIRADLCVFLGRTDEARTLYEENTRVGRLLNNDMVKTSLKMARQLKAGAL